MFNFDVFTNENNIKHNLKWPYIPDHPYRLFIIEGSGSGKTNAKTNNLNYLIDPTFSKVNRLFVLSLENEDGRAFFSKYYTSTVEIKDYNVVIGGKSFFDVPIITNKKHIKKLLK